MRNTAFLSMDLINENTAEGYLNLYNEDGRVIGYKKNIYCFPPMGLSCVSFTNSILSSLRINANNICYIFPSVSALSYPTRRNPIRYLTSYVAILGAYAVVTKTGLLLAVLQCK